MEPQCQNQRVRQDHRDLKYCVLHRCQTEGCPHRHGTMHTCEALPGQAPKVSPDGCHVDCNCACRADGNADAADGPRKCQFKSCKEEIAAEARYCAAHVCTQPGCEAVRGDGIFCKTHTCRHGGCNDGNSENMSWYCARHTCVVHPCREEALADGLCLAHGACSEMDYSKRRDVRDGLARRTYRQRELLSIHCFI
jgi:hypothetical protein